MIMAKPYPKIHNFQVYRIRWKINVILPACQIDQNVGIIDNIKWKHRINIFVPELKICYIYSEILETQHFLSFWPFKSE